MFVFNADSNALTLHPNYLKSIISGDFCPNPEKLTFEITSNILGTSTKTLDFAQSVTGGKRLPASTFNGNGALDEVA